MKKKISCAIMRSRGRLYNESHDFLRTEFERDRGRIIHSASFRRLMHKAQVFISPDNDHVRTRMSHCLEVAQIASCLARALGLNEVLAETIALAHDLGHPPFGHVGEDALREVSDNQFDHNEHTLKIIVTEQAYALFPGLNLTWETLEGIVKHNGPIAKPKPFIAWFNTKFDLMLDTYSSLEGQIAGLCDDIAYDHHDLDDGIRSGLFSLEEVIQHVDFVRYVHEEVLQELPCACLKVHIKEVIRRLINYFVHDVWRVTSCNIANVNTVEEVRLANRALASCSHDMKIYQKQLKKFLFTFMYRFPLINEQTQKAGQLIKALIAWYKSHPEKLPKNTNAIDFVAGMTDRFAIQIARKEKIFFYA